MIRSEVWQGYFIIVDVTSCEDGDCGAKIKFLLTGSCLIAVHVSDPFPSQAGRHRWL